MSDLPAWCLLLIGLLVVRCARDLWPEAGGACALAGVAVCL